MVKLRFRDLFILSMLVFMAGCTTPSDYSKYQQEDVSLVVFLVRHAEKVDHSRDPDLSEEGYARARALAVTLADAGIEGVFSSDYIRTRETARPVADLYGLEIEEYDPSELYDLADTLRAKGGRQLVVGHSNTTPALVEILGGEAGAAIVEETEYDRLYILTIGKGGVESLLLRYGKPCSSLPSRIKASSLLVPQISGSALKSEHTFGRSG